MNHNIFFKDRGISKKDNEYYYNKNNEKITNQREIKRLNSIKVPPAWKSLWFASNKNCHILAYGFDTNSKKQYILNEKWIEIQKNEKYSRTKRFIKKLDQFKMLIVFNNTLSKENLIKVLFNLLLDTHIRVGNEVYSKNNDTYGLTTFRNKHLVLKDNKYYFEFNGKSNIKHLIGIPSKYNKILTKLKIENKENLFSINNENITSEDLNTFLKENMDNEFSCKDFRTYSANIIFINTFLLFKNNNNNKSVINNCIKETAKLLGHSTSISKKSYISDSLINYCICSFEEAKSGSVDSLLSKI